MCKRSDKLLYPLFKFGSAPHALSSAPITHAHLTVQTTIPHTQDVVLCRDCRWDRPKTPIQQARHRFDGWFSGIAACCLR